MPPSDGDVAGALADRDRGDAVALRIDPRERPVDAVGNQAAPSPKAT
jgi:hypothetical protein